MDCAYHSTLPQTQTRNDQQSFQSTPDGLKPHSTHTTFKWLDKNYQLEEGVCLPRCTIYEHYQSYCETQRLQPVNAASFGKIVRQHFPSLTTRRLGTRGQSKYHYYGLGIKPTSEYYPSDYIDRVKQGNQKKSNETKKAVTHDKPSTILPVFPDVSHLILSENIPLDKLKTFMVMYRAHCQRILDSVVRANFNEVENFLLHFWQGMPSHMLPVLSSEVVIDLVAYCDTLLYQVICNVLITSPLQNLPESLAGEYRWFTDMLRQWMEIALKGLPESLQEAKYKVAEGFINGLRRQTSLTKLAQVAQSELRNSNSLNQLRQDWEGMDFQSVYAQTLYSIQPMKIPVKYSNLLPSFLQRFSDLLHEDTGLEHFLSFAEQMVQDAIGKGIEQQPFPLKDACQAFLLSWKFFNTKILEEFTLENAPSFGFFILLHMFLDDYITHLLETKLEKEEEKVYYSRINILKKKDAELSSSTLPNNLSSSSSSPLQSPDEEMPDTFDPSGAAAGMVLPPVPVPAVGISSTLKTEHVPVKNLEGFPGGGGAGPLNNLFSNLSNSFHGSDSSLSNPSGGGVALSNKHNSFYPSLTTSSHNLLPSMGSTDTLSGGSGPIGGGSGSINSGSGLGIGGQTHQKLVTPSGFTSTLNTFSTGINLHPKPTDRRSTPLIGYNQLSTTSTMVQPPSGPLRSSQDHLSPPLNYSAPQTNLFSSTTSESSQQQCHDQQQLPSSLTPSQRSLLSSIKPPTNPLHNISSSSSSFNVYSLSSSAPSHSNQQPHQDLPPCSLPVTTPSQTFSSQSIRQQLFPGVSPPTQHIAMTTPGQVAVSDLTNTQTHGIHSNNRSLSGLTGFPSLNVPYSNTNATSTTLSAGTNSLSIFPTVQGMYPYTQFVGIPTPLNNPFNHAGLPMPGTATPNQVPQGYPYLTNVPQSLYNPQISTTSYSRQ